ncbi:MAG: hypothetical protein ACR2O6_14310 [Ilumatobacteraceae bacterium]
MRSMWTSFAERWLGSRPAGALSYAVPFGAAVGASFVFASRLPAPPTFFSSVLRWIAIAVFSTIVFVATDRLVQRVAARSVDERSNLARAGVAGLGGLAGAIGIALSSTSVVAFDPLSFADPVPFVPGDPYQGEPAQASSSPGSESNDATADASADGGSKTLGLPRVALGPAVFAAQVVALGNGSSEDGTPPDESLDPGDGEPGTSTLPPTSVVDERPPIEDEPPFPGPEDEPVPATTIAPVTTTTVPPSTTTTTSTTTSTSTTSTTSSTSTTTSSTSTSTTSTSTTSTTTTTVPSGPDLSDPLYLGGEPADGEGPVFSLGGARPPAGALPNYDPDRNDDPGVTVKPTEHGTWAETDPERLVRFSTTVTSPTWVKGPASVTLYLAADDFVIDDLLVEASIYHCRGESCEKIQKSLQWFTTDDGFTPVTFEYEWLNVQYEAGERLELRVAPWAESELDLLVAFGTAEYPAVVEFSVYETY